LATFLSNRACNSRTRQVANESKQPEENIVLVDSGGTDCRVCGQDGDALDDVRTEFSMKFGNKIDVLEIMETGAVA
jgi:hypothetical protein